MTAQVNENTQYVDEDTGELLVNGFIYIGTEALDAKLNLITIYSDRDLTTVLDNPQRTGADGRALNKIFIPGRYSIKVENSANAQKLNDLNSGELAQTGNTVLDNVLGTNAITADASPTISVLVDKQNYIFTAANTNTGAMTLGIDATPVLSIVKNHDVALIAGDIEADQIVVVVYNDTDTVFELTSESAIPAVKITGAQTIAGNKTFSDDVTVNGAFTSLGIDDNATSNAITIDSSEQVIIGGAGAVSPDAVFHVHEDSAGTVDAHPNSVAVFENNLHAVLSLLAGGSSTGGIFVGDEADRTEGQFIYDLGTQIWTLNGAGSTFITINSTGVLALLAGPINEFKGADIASAATTDIGAATGNDVDVTGDVTITGLGTVQAGTKRTVTFTGIPLLTHNATSLILPGNVNIPVEAGDIVKFTSLGSGNWKCTNYQRDDRTPDDGWSLIDSDAIASGTTVPVTGIDTGFRELIFVIEGASSLDDGAFFEFAYGDGSYSTEIDTLVTTTGANQLDAWVHIKFNNISALPKLGIVEFADASATIRGSDTGTEIDQIQLNTVAGTATFQAAGNWFLYGLR